MYKLMHNDGFPPSWIMAWQRWTTHEVYMVTGNLCSNFMSINLVVSKILSIKLLQIWLKTPIQAAKIYVFGGFDPQTSNFIIETPKRHYLGGKHVLWAIMRRNRSSGMARTRCEEYTNKKNKQTKGRTKTCDKLGVRPAHPLNPILTKFGTWGGLPDVFLKFEFQDNRSINVGAVGGQNLPFPIDKAHRLYNSLLLPHKPWQAAHECQCLWQQMTLDNVLNSTQ